MTMGRSGNQIDESGIGIIQDYGEDGLP
jgi:hypothetical protein